APTPKQSTPPPGSTNMVPRTSPKPPLDHQRPAARREPQDRPRVWTATPTGLSTIPPPAGRSPRGYCTSTSRRSQRSPTPAGAATHRAPEPSRSTPSGGRATSPSVTESANVPTPPSSTPDGP